MTVEVGLRRFRGVKLKTLSNALAKDVTGRIGLHDLGHSLLDQWFHSREPVTVRRPQVVGQIHANHDTSRGRVDTHGIGDLIVVS